MANKSIIVPIDFTACSQHALRYAAAIARTTSGKLILVHSFYNSLSGPDLPPFNDSVTRERKVHDALRKMVDEMKEVYRVACDYITGSEVLPDLVKHVIKEKNAGLVVMGTEGASRINEFIWGTWAAEVVSTVNRPVIVVPEKAVLSDISRIVFATDLHRSDLPAIRQMVDFAKAFEAHLEVLHISGNENVSDAESHKMEDFMNLVETTINFTDITYRILPGKNVERSLENYLVEHKVSLMALSTRHRPWIEKVFGNSISQNMVMHAHTPLIVFHYEQPAIVLI